MLVYKITNTKNGKIYVGITTATMKRRFSQHCSVAGRGDRALLHVAIRKHGRDAFIIEEIGRATTLIDLLALEVSFIASMRAMDRSVGYNLTVGGEGTSGWVPSIETRAKFAKASSEYAFRPEAIARIMAIGRANAGRSPSTETRALLSSRGRGRIKTPEECQKLSAALLGKPRPASVRSLLSRLATGRKHTEASKKKMSDSRQGTGPTAECRAASVRAREAKRPEKLKGASPARGRWQAHIWRDGKSCYLGRFDTEHAAHAAYLFALEDKKCLSSVA